MQMVLGNPHENWVRTHRLRTSAINAGLSSHGSQSGRTHQSVCCLEGELTCVYTPIYLPGHGYSFDIFPKSIPMSSIKRDWKLDLTVVVFTGKAIGGDKVR